MATQGKCNKCKVRYTWRVDHPMCNVGCPKCHGGLVRTTHTSGLPHKYLIKAPVRFINEDGVCEVMLVGSTA